MRPAGATIRRPCALLAATQQFMFDRPWLPLLPGLPIVLSSLAFNYIGDGLRDALDPRLKL